MRSPASRPRRRWRGGCSGTSARLPDYRKLPEPLSSKTGAFGPRFVVMACGGESGRPGGRVGHQRPSTSGGQSGVPVDAPGQGARRQTPAERSSSAGADSVLACRILQVREATGLALKRRRRNRLSRIGRHNKRPAHHRTERCRPTRLHHHRHHGADSGITNNVRHECQATPQKVPRGAEPPFRWDWGCVGLLELEE